VADNTAGLLLAQAILLALLARERTGHGQMVETSLLDGLMAMCAWETTSALNKARAGEESSPQAEPGSDTEHDDAVGGQNPLDGAVFGTSDGYLMVSALFRPYPQPLRDLCAALGIDDISTDPRFATLPALISNTTALRATLEPVFAGRTTDEWVRQLESHDILCAPVRSTEEALQDPQLAVNRLIVEVEHPRVGRLRHVGTPLRLSKTSSRSPHAAPVLGQHTDEVLREIGYSLGEIGELRSKGVIA
jgi:formyl-CoA transferase